MSLQMAEISKVLQRQRGRMSRCQAKFLTCYCLSFILLLRVKE